MSENNNQKTKLLPSKENKEPSYQLLKEYKLDAPVKGMIDKLEEEYDNVKPERVLIDGGDEGVSMMADPMLSADEEGEVYARDVRMILDDGTEVKIGQNAVPTTRAIMGKDPEGDSYDEEYHMELTIRGSKRENVERAFETLYEEYEDILEDYSISEATARSVKSSQVLDGNVMDSENQSRSKSKLDQLEQEYSVDVSGYSKEDIALPDDVWDQVENLVEGPMKNPELFEKMGENPKGIALYGEPGVGKTLLAKVISSETSADMYSATISDLSNKYIGQSAQNVKNLFKMLKKNSSEESPSILFLDEADSLFKDRSNDQTHGEYRDMVNTFLSNMDGLEDTMENIMVIAATNDVEGMDDASIRDGRFDARIKLPKPTKEARENIFRIHTTEESPDLYDDIDMESLSELSEDMTGAEIAGAVKSAKLEVMNDLKSQYDDIADIPPEEFVIDQETLESSIEEKKTEDLSGEKPEIGFTN